MKEKLIKILNTVVPGINIEAETGLVDDGILDSLALINIIEQISMEFNILIPFDELDSIDFNSVENMMEMIKKYQART